MLRYQSPRSSTSVRADPGERTQNVEIRGGIREIIVKRNNFKKLAVGTALGVFAVLGTSTAVDAQNTRKEQKQEQKIERQQAKIDRQRAKLMRERQQDWARRNNQIVVNRRTGTGYYTLDPNGEITTGRYRVVRNNRTYNTDHRGAALLRNAVNEGYRQGFNAGRSDYSSMRRTGWSNSNVYRTGTMGYQNSVDRGQYQYYFQQGFQRGYQDGVNQSMRYGYRTNNGLSILGSVLGTILQLAND